MQRHAAATMALARELHESGWTPTEIARYLDRRGLKVPMTTVRAWVLPPQRSDAYREAHAAHAREMRAAKRDTEAMAAQLEDAMGTMFRLRSEDKLSYGAISVVLREYHGITLTPQGVRYRLAKMGAPRNPNKARATRAQMAATS